MKPPRILITRTRAQASILAAQLNALGAETIGIPTIEILPSSSFAGLDLAIESLGNAENSVDWLIFTSANAVQALAERADILGRRLHSARIAAIGPATAKAVEQSGIIRRSLQIFIPTKYVAESLVGELLEQAAGLRRHFLLVRADEARDVIPVRLEAAGHTVTIASAYRNATPPDTLAALRRLFNTPGEQPDAITFTSSSTARNLIRLLESVGRPIPPGIALASIGPITSATLRELGYEPTFEADEPTIESLVSAIAEHFALK